jgi:iron complex transport system substrate-binding protein
MRTPKRLSAAVLVAVATAAATAGCTAASGSPTTAASGTAATSAAPAASPTPTSVLIPVFPTTVAATNGAVTIKSEPGRIVSLDPTATEDLYAIGAGSQVVAVDQNSDWPVGVPTTSLSGLTPNIAAIAKYDPSRVIAAQDSNGLVNGLAKLRIPVLIEPPVTTVADVYAQIGQLGSATGHANQAAEVTKNMREEINDAVRQVGDKYRGMTYYWEVSSGPYYAATSATLVGHIMDMFGLRNIADKAPATPADNGYPELSRQYIVKARPELIFLADNEPAYGLQTPAVVAKRAGWAGIPAVKNGDVFGLNDDVASRWGPRLPSLVIAITSALNSLAAG